MCYGVLDHLGLRLSVLWGVGLPGGLGWARASVRSPGARALVLDHLGLVCVLCGVGPPGARARARAMCAMGCWPPAVMWGIVGHLQL